MGKGEGSDEKRKKWGSDDDSSVDPIAMRMRRIRG